MPFPKTAGGPLPLADAILPERGGILRLAVDMLQARARGAGDYARARERYREAIMSLAGQSPGKEPWQVERELLPDVIANPLVRFAGLPESRLPFSLLGGWINRRLEAALDDAVPQNGKRSSYLRLISRILDRYVESFFPMERIPDFYRPAVLFLHRVSGRPGAYESMVIEQAGPLADAAILSLLTENANLLKMSSHKNIHIQTGVHLSEQHSSPYRNPASKAGFNHGKRFIGPSVSGSLGIDVRTQNLHPVLGARLGLPAFDRILAAKTEKEYPAKDEVLECMQYVMRTGKPPAHSHPDIPGMEFSPAQCGMAADLVIAAQKKLAKDDSCLDALPAEALNAALFISAMRPFREACGKKDGRAQLRIALEALAVELRVKELSVRFGLEDAGEQAQKDIEMARNFVDEYRSPPDNPEMVLRSVKRMRQLADTAECADMSDYEIALMVVDERHRKKEPLSTIRPPSDSSLPPVPEEPRLPRPSALPADLQEPSDDVIPAGDEALPSGVETPEVEIDVDLDSLGPDSAAQAYGDEAEAGPTEPVAVAPLAAAREAAAETGPAAELAAESAHAAPKPQIAEAAPLPKFDFPFQNSPLDPGLEPILPPKTDGRNTLIRRVARALVFYKLSNYAQESIDARCVAAVNRLKANYSSQAALDFATAIVDGAVSPEYAVAPVPVKSLSEMLGAMDEAEKELVARVMGAQYCDEQALSGFLALAPANRELLIRRFIARRWIDGDFRTDIPRFMRARESVYSSCGLARPTPMEKLSAILEPANLSDEQLFMVRYLFRTSGPITPQHVEALGVWISSDPSTGEGRARLGEYWNRVLVPSHSGAFNITSGIWMNTPLPDRLRLWRGGASDVLSAGSLVHRLRFGDGGRLSFDEAALVSELYGKTPGEAWALSDQSKQNLSMALTQHTYKDGVNLYYPEMLALAKLPYAFSVPLPGKPGGANPLHYSAMREMEFNTMAEFLGVPLETATGSLTLSHGSSRAKLGNGNGPKPNEDAWSCAKVTLSDGTAITLDMVADGMGGHTRGSNGGRTNGQVASGIAREVFETAAVAGWIREPEDVRRIVLVADLAVVLEQMRKKAYGAALKEVTSAWADSGVDVQNMNPAWVPEFNAQVAAKFAEHMRSADAVQVNDMGTTMTVAFQRGNRLWFIHCGDSDGKVMRDADIIFNTVGHSAEYELRLNALAAAREELAEAYANQGADASILDEAGLQKFEREAAVLYQQRVEPMKDFFDSHKNVVSAVLGVSPKYVHINNAERGAPPIELEDGDVIWVSSDGITVPVCDHEIPLIIYGKCLGDLGPAREELISLAESRRSAGPNQTMCECKERAGKNDDKTITLRYARDAMENPAGGSGVRSANSVKERFGAIASRIESNPAGAALSKSFRLMLQGCADSQLPAQDVLEAFESITSAAESAPRQFSADAHSLAISSIFLTLSRRQDGEELMRELVPRIGSWSGLILKKLRDSPDASERKRLMFDFASACVPEDALESLLAARNADIARWARDAIGVTDGIQPVAHAVYASSSAPQPIFNSQTDEAGGPLDIWSTRYLDTAVLEISGSSIVQDTARRLGVLPRDLEIMAFYAYSDFQLQVSTDPHMSAVGQNLIAAIGDHLCTGDAGRILEASYLLYRLRETAPAPAEARQLAAELRKTVKAMDTGAPYSVSFYNKACGYDGMHP